MKISQFKTDRKAELAGVWKAIGDGAEVLVARAGNPRHRMASRRAYRPHLAQVRAGTLDAEVSDRIEAEIIAETILLGWKGLQDERGQEIPFSRSAAAQLLTDYPDFRRLVADLADDMEAFRAELLEDAAGKSGSGSSSI